MLFGAPEAEVCAFIFNKNMHPPDTKCIDKFAGGVLTNAGGLGESRVQV